MKKQIIFLLTLLFISKSLSQPGGWFLKPEGLDENENQILQIAN